MNTARQKRAKERIQQAIDKLRIAQEEGYSLLIEPIIANLQEIIDDH